MTRNDPFQAMIRTAAAQGYIGTGRPSRVPASDRNSRQQPSTPASLVTGVTERQAIFMGKLTREKADIYASYGRATEAEAVRGMDLEVLFAGMTKQGASQAIDRMMAANKELRTELAAAKAAAVPAVGAVKVGLEDGVYKLDGHVVRVYHTVHGSNQQVAGYWVPATDEAGQPIMVERKGRSYQDGDWDYRGKAPIRRLTPADKMPVAEAEEFGQVYGRCCKCGRVLTLKASIDRGMGSVCAGWF